MDLFDKRFNFFLAEFILEPYEKRNYVLLVPSDQVGVNVAGPVFLFTSCLGVRDELHQILFREIEKFFMEQNLAVRGS